MRIICNCTPVPPNNPFFPVLGTPVGSVYVLRDRPSGSGTIETAMNDLDFTAHFASGPLQHTLVFGFEYDNESASLVRFVNQDTVITPVPILAPDPFEAFPGTQTSVNQRPKILCNLLCRLWRARTRCVAVRSASRAA